jgi:hypothetical protein
MISTGLLAPEGVCELNAPMVYLAPDRHAFLVLGDGSEPLITWSTSFQFASEQADIHGGVVVAVPIVRDSSWRRSHGDDPTQVPVRLTSMPHRDGPAQSAGEPTITPDRVVELIERQMRAEPLPPPADGYPLGRAASASGGQGSPDGWSSARPDVEGQRDSREGLVRRSQPFGDPAAPLLPEDPEAALRAAFGGGCGPATDEAMTAFHTPGHADVATLEKLRDGLGHE